VVRPTGGAQQEAARALVGGGPDGVAHALEAEHAVVDVERQHGKTVHAVAGGRGRPAGNGAGLADALFQNLAVQRLAVAQHRANVFGLVALAHAAVDADLLEQVGHAKGARLVGHDGHDARAQFCASFSRLPSMRTKAMVVDISLPAAVANAAYDARAGTGSACRR
jgi:hypothetical protein